MDFRSSRPEREAIPRSEPVRTTLPEEPQPKKETPATVQRIGASHHIATKDKPKRPLVPIAIVVVALLIIGALIAWFMRPNGGASGIESGKYQAVFLSNNQVYFGKLQAVNDQYFKLTKVFYIQGSSDTDNSTSKDPQQTTSNDLKLIKLCKEVHGPEDSMIINRDQVQFYENLKSDSEVVKLINQYKQ